jgi:hypothetical protein
MADAQDRGTEDTKQKQRAEEKLREMRDKEQSKVPLHHHESMGALKALSAMSPTVESW